MTAPDEGATSPEVTVVEELSNLDGAIEVCPPFCETELTKF